MIRTNRGKRGEANDKRGRGDAARENLDRIAILSGIVRDGANEGKSDLRFSQNFLKIFSFFRVSAPTFRLKEGIMRENGAFVINTIEAFNVEATSAVKAKSE